MSPSRVRRRIVALAVTALLAGGMGRRLGGEKASLEIGGRPFVSPSEKPTQMEGLKYYRRVAETFGLPVAFEPVRLSKILGEVLSIHGIRQFRIAETEKYAHVTFFFNGGSARRPICGSRFAACCTHCALAGNARCGAEPLWRMGRDLRRSADRWNAAGVSARVAAEARGKSFRVDESGAAAAVIDLGEASDPGSQTTGTSP